MWFFCGIDGVQQIFSNNKTLIFTNYRDFFVVMIASLLGSAVVSLAVSHQERFRGFIFLGMALVIFIATVKIFGTDYINKKQQ